MSVSKKKTMSDAAIAANKRNGKKGGVKTPGGKTKSRLNRLTHGLRAAHMIVRPGEEAPYLAHLNAYLQSFQPVDDYAYGLVLRMAQNDWRSENAVMLEGTVKNESAYMEQLLILLNRLALYESRLEGNSSRCMLKLNRGLDYHLKQQKLTGLPFQRKPFQLLTDLTPNGNPLGLDPMTNIPVDKLEGLMQQAQQLDISLSVQATPATPQQIQRLAHLEAEIAQESQQTSESVDHATPVDESPAWLDVDTLSEVPFGFGDLTLAEFKELFQVLPAEYQFFPWVRETARQLLTQIRADKIAHEEKLQQALKSNPQQSPSDVGSFGKNTNQAQNAKAKQPNRSQTKPPNQHPHEGPSQTQAKKRKKH